MEFTTQKHVEEQKNLNAPYTISDTQKKLLAHLQQITVSWNLFVEFYETIFNEDIPTPTRQETRSNYFQRADIIKTLLIDDFELSDVELRNAQSHRRDEMPLYTAVLGFRQMMMNNLTAMSDTVNGYRVIDPLTTALREQKISLRHLLTIIDGNNPDFPLIHNTLMAARTTAENKVELVYNAEFDTPFHTYRVTYHTPMPVDKTDASRERLVKWAKENLTVFAIDTLPKPLPTMNQFDAIMRNMEENVSNMAMTGDITNLADIEWIAKNHPVHPEVPVYKVEESTGIPTSAQEVIELVENMWQPPKQEMSEQEAADFFSRSTDSINVLIMEAARQDAAVTEQGPSEETLRKIRENERY